MESNIRLSIKSLIYSKLQNDVYVLTLAETDGDRQIPIIIGSSEAESIIVAVEGIKSPRPLTHDLFCHLTRMVKLHLQHVEIYKFRDGIFYARLYFLNENQETITLDSRTSDAVALAIRYKCPIFTNDNVLNTTGIPANEITQFANNSTPKVNENQTTPRQQLLQQMNEAIENEDYEKAAIIRDEINNLPL